MERNYTVSSEISETMHRTHTSTGFQVTERYFSNDESLPTIGIANIHAVVPDIKGNKGKIVEVLDIFKAKKVNIAVFPEFCLSGYFWEDEQDCRAYMEEAVIDNHVDWINSTIKSYTDDNLRAIIFNNIRRGSGSKYLNSTYVIREGQDPLSEESIYDKVFLPKIEQIYTENGTDDSLVIDTKWGRFGLTTCYDICFSQLVLEYAKIDEVDAIVETASWRAHGIREYRGMNVGTDTYYGLLWNLLLSARAATNQVWIIACNAVGRHEITGATFCGASGLWAPSGLNILQASSINEELLIIHNVDIRGQRELEKDAFNYALDFGAIYRPIHGKRAFSRIEA